MLMLAQQFGERYFYNEDWYQKKKKKKKKLLVPKDYNYSVFKVDDHPSFFLRPRYFIW